MESEVRELFYAEVKAFTDSEGLELATPNIKFDPEGLNELAGENVWLGVSVLPVAPSVVHVEDAGSRYIWLGQVSAYVRDNYGDLIATDLLGKIKAAFPPLHNFVGSVATYQITRPATAAPPVPVEGWSLHALTFRIQTIK